MNAGPLALLALLVATGAVAQDGTPAADAMPGVDGTELRDILAPAGDVVARVGREFAAFDADYSGELESREFVKWITQLKLTQLTASGAEPDENAARAWAATAFTVADADGSGGVSPPELISFLGG